MSTIEPGTVMYKLKGQGWITRDTVERLTPTGIVVLSRGTRLNPSSFAYRERGASSVWETSAWYPEDSERVTKARAYNLERARLTPTTPTDRRPTMTATEHDPIATEAMRIAPLTSLSVEEIEHALRKLAEVLNESAGQMQQLVDAAQPEHRYGRAAQVSPFGPARKGGRR